VVDGVLHEVGGVLVRSAQFFEPASHVIVQFDFPIHGGTITILL
jgi:hypothetical protein